MTEAECWQQIEQFAKDKDYAGVAVWADALQERGWGPRGTLCWWATKGHLFFPITYYYWPSGREAWYYKIAGQTHSEEVSTFEEAINVIHQFREAILSITS